MTVKRLLKATPGCGTTCAPISAGGTSTGLTAAGDFCINEFIDPTDGCMYANVTCLGLQPNYSPGTITVDSPEAGGQAVRMFYKKIKFKRDLRRTAAPGQNFFWAFMRKW